MFCEKCGKPIPEGAAFCEGCGARISQPDITPAADGKNGVSDSGRVTLCPDGKYRWYYDFPMLKNPTILFTVWKVMLIAAAFPALVVLLSGLSDGFLSALKQFAAVLGVAFGIVFVLSCIGYFITAAIYGFRYMVLFEMDEEGVIHTQKARQFKKAEAISWLTLLAGAAANNHSAMGTGLLAGTKYRMVSDFKNVSAVIGLKKRNTIKVNQLFARNQVYVQPEDYDFVWKYITSRCIKAKIK